MRFNNEINHFILWCNRKAADYHAAYQGYGGVLYVGYQIAHELDFKLSALIDKDFENRAALREEILGSIDIHYNPAVLHPQNNTAKHIISKVNHEFCAYLDALLAKEDLPLAELPYTRVVIGSEAVALQNRFRSVWGYEASYWYPLTRKKQGHISEKFFIMFDYLAPYMKQLEQIIGLPQVHIYAHGERSYAVQYCLETAHLVEYSGNETMYTDQDFSWAIYFSHEDTVAFAGTIVPKVKELLSNEKDHFDKFEADWMPKT